DQGRVLGRGVAGGAVERGVQHRVEARAELRAADLVGAREIDLHPAAAGGLDRPRGDEVGERGGLGVAGLDGEPAGEPAAALARVEDGGEDGPQPRRPPEQGSHRRDRLGGDHAEDATTARRLLGPDRERAFEDGCAPALASALAADVTRALSAERAPQYLNLLYALLLLRRGHELEPRHEDL